MNITLAEPCEAAALTAIAQAAKSHWGYPPHWLAAWQADLTLTPAYITAHETYAARDGTRPIGFSSLRRDGATLHLDHLWVLPGEMGRGIGRALFRHAQQRANALGFAQLEIESDPHAAGFYERMGAERIHTRMTHLDGQRRELPVFRCATLRA